MHKNENFLQLMSSKKPQDWKAIADSEQGRREKEVKCWADQDQTRKRKKGSGQAIVWIESGNTRCRPQNYRMETKTHDAEGKTKADALPRMHNRNEKKNKRRQWAVGRRVPRIKKETQHLLDRQGTTWLETPKKKNKQ